MNDAQQLVASLKQKGIGDERVLNAIGCIPRTEFVSPDWLSQAYDDQALPLTRGQTISQPYVVARMTELLCQSRTPRRVLEIGTGSGYQAAVLAQIAMKVYSVERIRSLYETAQQRLQRYPNIECRFGDGHLGRPEKAPFDGIMVTAAGASVPEALVEQLAEGGRLLMPVGDPQAQQLVVVDKHAATRRETVFDAVRFVPLLSGKQED